MKRAYQSAGTVYWMTHAQDKVIIPGSVDIDLTNICNQDCFYCNSARFREASPGGPQLNDYITLLDRLSAWRTHSPNSMGTLYTVNYPGGGEPSLFKGFESVIEHTLDLKFFTSVTTNGYRLDKLVDHVPHHKLRKLAWIGIDVDAGEPELYEQIRRTVSQTSIFDQVIANATALINIGVNVDFKVLLGEVNTNAQALENIFLLSKKTGVRLLYFRPMIIDNRAFVITDQLISTLETLSAKHGQAIKINLGKTQPRNYSRCHQMFQFPVFCADGSMYTCCEHKGDPRFSIGSWNQADFRDIWLSQRHHDIYNSINTNFCKPCRPNEDNIEIQNIIDNPQQLENLYL